MSSGKAERRTGVKEGKYSNFFQIGHNEFEVLIEFGQQDHGIQARIYVTPQCARVLSSLLMEGLREREHEDAGADKVH